MPIPAVKAILNGTVPLSKPPTDAELPKTDPVPHCLFVNEPVAVMMHAPASTIIGDNSGSELPAQEIELKLNVPTTALQIDVRSFGT
jgi:hypothetical protein